MFKERRILLTPCCPRLCRIGSRQPTLIVASANGLLGYLPIYTPELTGGHSKAQNAVFDGEQEKDRDAFGRLPTLAPSPYNFVSLRIEPYIKSTYSVKCMETGSKLGEGRQSIQKRAPENAKRECPVIGTILHRRSGGGVDGVHIIPVAYVCISRTWQPWG